MKVGKVTPGTRGPNEYRSFSATKDCVYVKRFMDIFFLVDLHCCSMVLFHMKIVVIYQKLRRNL